MHIDSKDHPSLNKIAPLSFHGARLSFGPNLGTIAIKEICVGGDLLIGKGTSLICRGDVHVGGKLEAAESSMEIGGGFFNGQGATVQDLNIGGCSNFLFGLRGKKAKFKGQCSGVGPMLIEGTLNGDVIRVTGRVEAFDVKVSRLKAASLSAANVECGALTLEGDLEAEGVYVLHELNARNVSIENDLTTGFNLISRGSVQVGGQCNCNGTLDAAGNVTVGHSLSVKTCLTAKDVKVEGPMKAKYVDCQNLDIATGVVDQNLFARGSVQADKLSVGRGMVANGEVICPEVICGFDVNFPYHMRGSVCAGRMNGKVIMGKLEETGIKPVVQPEPGPDPRDQAGEAGVAHQVALGR